MQQLALTTWLGESIDPLGDPFYRFERTLKALESVTNVPRGSTWLDLGCHLGQFIRLLQNKYQVIATGVDQYTPDNLVWTCQIQNIPVTANEQILDSSWTYLTLGEQIQGTFDFVSALETLEHIIDTDKFLEMCKSKLNNNGILLLTTPNINSLRNRIFVPFGRYPQGLEYKNNIHHVRLYNVACLESHLAEHGFKKLFLGGTHFLPAKLHKSTSLLRVSETLANLFPQLCPNLIAIYQKQ